MDQRERYRSTPPQRTLDDMPLAAYGGSGMEDDGVPPEADPATHAEVVAAVTGPTTALAVSSPTAARTPRSRTDAKAAPDATATAPSAPATAGTVPGGDLPVPEDEPSHGPSPLARILHLFRSSRIAAGAGFAVVIVVGLVLLTSGGGSPKATAATPTNDPTAAPTVSPPSGDVSLTLSGAATGTYTLAGLAGGQQVSSSTVALGWGDSLQTTLSIAGPLDRGTRATDEHLVLTLGVLVDGVAVTFASTAGECTVGMAPVGTKVQGSFTCHKLKSADGKLSIEASGTYRS